MAIEYLRNFVLLNGVQRGGRTGRRPRASKESRVHPKSEITKIEML